MSQSRNIGVDPTYELQKRNHGKTYLLVIAIDQYQHFQNLHNCIKDAETFVNVLTNRYQFSSSKKASTYLFNENATREAIINTIENLSQLLTDKDDLLIYFAGHGYLHKKTRLGHLVPYDAHENSLASLIPNSYLREFISSFEAHHILLIVDSCFSGSIFRGYETGKTGSLTEIEKYADRVDIHPSRYGLAAGMIEKVSDGIIGNHSPFAKSLISFLDHNKSNKLPVSELIQHVCKITTYNAKQTPIGGILFETNHEGGQFIFRKKKLKTTKTFKNLSELPDIKAWKYARDKDTISFFREYLNSFPDGKYREIADKRINYLLSQERQQQEISFFENVVELDSMEGYESYLAKFPKGIFQSSAEEKLKLFQIQVKQLEEENLRAGKLEAYINQARKFQTNLKFKKAIDIWNEALLISKPQEINQINQELSSAREELEKIHYIKSELNLEMVFVKGGNFQLGGILPCQLSDFEIGKFPITNYQWKRVMKSVKRKLPFEGEPESPVVNVSWQEVKQFLYNLNQQTGGGYTLPTEAQWEFAALGGKLSEGYLFAGSNNLEEVGWFWKNSGLKPLSGTRDIKLLKKNLGQAKPVMKKKPNELGIFDLSGNVWEWCSDIHINFNEQFNKLLEKNKVSRKGDFVDILMDPQGPDLGKEKVLRGGSWSNSESYCRVSHRYFAEPSYRENNIGFRLARKI